MVINATIVKLNVVFCNKNKIIVAVNTTEIKIMIESMGNNL